VFSSYDLLRIGAYGDPLSAPWHVTEQVLHITRMKGKSTGYTHLWMNAESLGAEESKSTLTASCDSLFDEAAARLRGWSTFTSTPNGSMTPVLGNKPVLCPNQKTEGRVTCDSCKKCSGTKNGLVAIRASEHGSRSKAKIKKGFSA
jgi:hypothetical protein